jgi:hypothetical protein
MGLNIDEFKSGGLHEKHAVASWNWYKFQLLLQDMKTKDDIFRESLSQDLLDAH